MRPANRAPAYAVLYHGLADRARRHGYALAIHGSVATDLDLVAIPWTEDAGTPEELAEELRWLLDAVGHPGDLEAPLEWEDKPHGRRAVNLYLGHGAKVDLSVMPRRRSE